MTTCKKCGRSIYFLRTKNDKLIPVDKDSVPVEERIAIDNGREVMFRFGEHITHFKTCPFADSFRNK